MKLPDISFETSFSFKNCDIYKNIAACSIDFSNCTGCNSEEYSPLLHGYVVEDCTLRCYTLYPKFRWCGRGKGGPSNL